MGHKINLQHTLEWIEIDKSDQKINRNKSETLTQLLATVTVFRSSAVKRE